jgi:hypothetical protein
LHLSLHSPHFTVLLCELLLVHHLPLLLLDLEAFSNPENKKGERERVRQPKKSFFVTTLHPLAATSIAHHHFQAYSHPTVPRSFWIPDLAGRPAAPEVGKG